MSRRTALPGADELFRTTVVPVAAEDEPLRAVPDLAAAPSLPSRATASPGGAPDRQPTGRQRHDEKITVYVSAAELMELEQARLTLRGAHGLALDRGRIVREALAVVLADLNAAGADSVLVRRLRER